MRDLIVKILVKLHLYHFSVNVINRMKSKKMSKYVNKYGLATLCEMDEAFSSVGVKMCLMYGTLLGGYREHGFISYDPDIDVAVRADSLPENYSDVLKKHGFDLIKQNFFKENGQVIEECYRRNGISIDVFMMFPSDDGTIKIYSPRKHEYKEWKEANATDGFPTECQTVDQCDFERQPFMDKSFYFPVKINEWLTDMYSENYMTPIKNYDDTDPKRRVIFPVEYRAYRRYFNE